jgi:hypothetical protein
MTSSGAGRVDTDRCRARGSGCSGRGRAAPRPSPCRVDGTGTAARPKRARAFRKKPTRDPRPSPLSAPRRCTRRRAPRPPYSRRSGVEAAWGRQLIHARHRTRTCPSRLTSTSRREESEAQSWVHGGSCGWSSCCFFGLPRWGTGGGTEDGVRPTRGTCSGVAVTRLRPGEWPARSSTSLGGGAATLCG